MKNMNQLKHFIPNENEKFRRLQYFVKFSRYTVICEMFESKAIFLNEKFKCNPRKCNFASSFSGCVQRNKSKMIIALPTKAETVPLFEKKLIGGFTGVSTRLEYDTNFLLFNKDEESKR